MRAISQIFCLLFAMTMIIASPAAAQNSAGPIEGAFGIRLLQQGEQLETQGFQKRQPISDSSELYWSRNDHEFFSTIMAAAHPDSGLVRNIYAFRTYPEGDLSGANCGSDFDGVVATIRQRYPSLRMHTRTPMTRNTRREVFLAPRIVSNQWPGGRYVVITCQDGRNGGTIRLSVSYHLSLEESQQLEAQIERVRTRRAAEGARERGLRPEDF